MPEERRQNLAETDRGSYYNEGEWLGDKGVFYDGSESDDGENDGGNFIEKYNCRFLLFIVWLTPFIFENVTPSLVKGVVSSGSP